MSYYRRLYIPGAIYFFTVVTFGRMPILTKPAVRRILRAAYRQTCDERPFETIAIVLLPDHLHCLWRLPDGDSDFSTRWKLIKGRFTSALPETGIALPPPSPSRAKRGEQTAWHRRFWEHLVRDENDLKRHADYIHYNPVKHGYAQRPADWPFSTFKVGRQGRVLARLGGIRAGGASGVGTAGGIASAWVRSAQPTRTA